MKINLTKEELYLLGTPIFDTQPKKEFLTPCSTTKLYQNIIAEIQDGKDILLKLQEEYVAIVYALKQMGIEFRIIYAHENMMDKKVLAICLERLGCRLAGFGNVFSPSVVLYPRDFGIILPKLVLISSRVAKRIDKQNKTHKISISDIGEGGRTLICGDTMLVSERFIIKDGHSRPVEPSDLEEITQVGIKVGLFPLHISQRISPLGEVLSSFSADHVDRVACMIKGKDGKPNLVVDPEIKTVSWIECMGIKSLPDKPEVTEHRIRTVCEDLGINVHYPKEIRVPYSLNLIQFHDGRVLMTGGDEPVAEVISDIVGKENVFVTPTPIRFFPVWSYAGIRCLVTEAPSPILKKAK